MEKKELREAVRLQEPEIVTYDAEELKVETALTSEPVS